MLARQFDIRVPMPGTEAQFSVCRCTTPESAAEIVRVLLSAGDGGPKLITVEVFHVEEVR